MNTREFNISRLREIAGTYKSKKALLKAAYELVPNEQWEYATQYVQLVNNKGTVCNWYNDELSRLNQVTIITHPDRKVSILPYYLSR